MIKLKIEKYRDFTEEENKAREEWKKKNNRFDTFINYDTLTPAGVEKYFEKSMEVEISESQWEAIRKAVIDVF